VARAWHPDQRQPLRIPLLAQVSALLPVLLQVLGLKLKLKFE
jgi:hypothetical protein